MTEEEIKKLFADFKAQGRTDFDILKVLYSMFEDRKLSVQELETMIDILGYEFTEHFKNLSLEDKRKKGWTALFGEKK